MYKGSQVFVCVGCKLSETVASLPHPLRFYGRFETFIKVCFSFFFFFLFFLFSYFFFFAAKLHMMGAVNEVHVQGRGWSLVQIMSIQADGRLGDSSWWVD